MDTNTKRARFIGHYKGRKVYAFPVEVTKNIGVLGNIDTWLNPGKEHWVVTSHTAADAANYVRDQFATRPETEITAYGPKGGRAAYRYVGFESSIWGQMMAPRGPEQLALLGGAR